MNSNCDTSVIKPPSVMSEEMMDLLKCPLCKDFFVVPVLLPSCSHNFCYGCVGLPGNVGVEKCPTCGQRVHDEDMPVRNEILDELVRIFRESIQVSVRSGDESTYSTLIESEDVSATSQDESMVTESAVGNDNVPCPVCLSPIPNEAINNHLDGCLMSTEENKESKLCRSRKSASKDESPLKKATARCDGESSSARSQSTSADETTLKKRHKSKFWTYEPVLNDVQNMADDVASTGSLKPVSKTRVIIDEDSFKDETSRRRRGRSLHEMISTSDSEDVSNIDRETNAQPGQFTLIRTKTRQQAPLKMTRCLSGIPKEHVALKKGPVGTLDEESPRRRSLRVGPSVCHVADEDSTTSTGQMTNRRSSRTMSSEASSATAEHKIKHLNLASPRSCSEGRLNYSVGDHGNSKNKKRSSKFWTYEVVIPSVVQDSPPPADTEGRRRSTLRSSSAVSDAKPSPRSHSEGRVKGLRVNGNSDSMVNKNANSAKKKGSSKFWTYVPVGRDIESTVTMVTDMVQDAGSFTDLSAGSDVEGKKRLTRRSRSAVSSEARPGSASLETSSDLDSKPSRLSSKERSKVLVRKREGSTFWTYLPVVDQEVKLTGVAVSSAEREKRASRRSCSAGSSNVTVSKTECRDMNLQAPESDIPKKDLVSGTFDKKSALKKSLKRDKRYKVTKKLVSKFWTYVPVVPGAHNTKVVTDLSDNVGGKRSSRRSCIAVSSGSETDKSAMSKSEGRSRDSKNKPVAKKISGKNTTAEESIDLSDKDKRNRSSRLSLAVVGAVSESAQNDLAGSSGEVLRAAVTPSRKRKRSTSRNPAPVHTLSARHKRPRTDETCFGKKLNKSAGSQSFLSEQGSSSEDVYDFDSSEENIPESLGGSQAQKELQAAGSELAARKSSCLMSPEIGPPRQRKDKTGFVTPKQTKKKSYSETFEQDHAGFRSPFTSPTSSLISAPKPITPLIAGIFCNSPAFGAVKFAEDEDQVDGFGYVDDSSSEADSDDDLLGSISQRIDNFDEEESDQPDINHNIPSKEIEIEKLWPALSKRPSVEPEPSASNTQPVVRESPRKSRVENSHLVPESPIIHRLGERGFRKRTPGDQQPKPRHIGKAKKRL
ncbi:uncharacterized protein LOC135491024 [Lineus longissimus]|uniref:uncharacterized protein LOC135491024 n=1 Tax=Lineus longissimus TaxID=88925 RepID=UPI002B4D2A6C